MQLELGFRHLRSSDLQPEHIVVRGRPVRLHLVRNRRARRYVLRLRPDGAARVTIPRGGSVLEAKRFLQRNVSWIEKQLLRQAIEPAAPRAWSDGTEILFRGEPAKVQVESMDGKSQVHLGDQVFPSPTERGDLRPLIENHLRQVAVRELTDRLEELAAFHQVKVRRVSVRNQRSRWGSCSPHGTISLNWRLIQTPPFVRDYIILHEMAHLKEMNHSQRFWREVARLCPEFELAERWLKQHAKSLL